MKDKLLLIHKTQFGYHTNAFKHCYYLKEKFDISFICFAGNKKRINMEGVNIIYVPSKLPYILRAILFFIYTFWNLIFFKGTILVYYFKGCAVYKKVFKRKRMILDVRTLSVSSDDHINNINDRVLYQTALSYDYVTFLSESMREKILFPHEKSAIVPLGADIISTKSKSYDKLELLYVGTITNRHIERTLYGLKAYIEKYHQRDIKYHIIGDGYSPNELPELVNLAKELNLDKYVTFYGRIPNNELKPYFDLCNVGVSFVPMTNYFDAQPVTKTYEYAMSGLIVIGTQTSANINIINTNNGVLINDDALSFCEALNYIQANHTQFIEQNIRESLIQYQWKTIVQEKLLQIIKNI